MDPLTALSVASNIIQFVDFGCKLVSKTRQIYKSKDGTLTDKVLVEDLAIDLTSLSLTLRKSLRQNRPFDALDHAESLEDNEALEKLCIRCIEIATKLIARLNKLKIEGSSRHRNWESFKLALRASWSNEAVDSLAAQLNDVRSEIEFRVLVSFRYNIILLLSEKKNTLSTMELSSLAGRPYPLLLASKATLHTS
jgi:hypothetical protein